MGVHLLPSASAAFFGPYLHLYTETEEYSTFGDCGEWIDRYERWYAEDGSMTQNWFEDQDDCYDAAYGHTAMHIDQEYPLGPLQPSARHWGWARGVPVDYIEENPNYYLPPAWWRVADLFHVFPNEFDDDLVYTCTANADVRVKAGSPFGTRTGQLVVLQVDAWYWEFDETSGWWAPIAPIPFNEINIAARTPNCNGIVSFEIQNGGQEIVTPSAPYDFYDFYLTPIIPFQVSRTKSHHPNHPNPRSPQQLQNQFDTASFLLLSDDDDCLNDSGPLTADDEIEDDVPVYAEFSISAAAQATFPAPYGDAKYLDIDSVAATKDLLAAGFSQIKLIRSFVGEELGTLASADSGNGTGNMVLSDDASRPSVLAHEWLHTNLLPHRGEPGNPRTNDLGEYGRAILHPSAINPRYEVNRFERSWIFQ